MNQDWWSKDSDTRIIGGDEMQIGLRLVGASDAELWSQAFYGWRSLHLLC